MQKEINGVWFTYHPRAKLPYYGCYDKWDIYDAYKKPSSCKVSIWRYWVEWCYSMEDCEYPVITGANCMTFTIMFDFVHEGKEYRAHITKYHNHLYPLD